MAKSKKFKQTKDLVRIALNEGKTQDAIAKMCRVVQPTVSKWKGGKALASHSQMKPLLDEYGHRLFRAPFKLYEHPPNEGGKTKFLRVEGKLILRDRFLNYADDSQIKAVRVSVHHQGVDQFVFVVEKTTAGIPTKSNRENGTLLLTDRHAKWLVVKADQASSEILLGLPEAFTKYFENPAVGRASFLGLERLPFILREALLKHGFSIDDLEEMPLPA